MRGVFKSSKSSGLRWLSHDKTDAYRTLVIYPESRAPIIFVTDLVNRLSSSGAAVQAIWTINHDTINVTYVFVSVYDALWHQNGNRIHFPNDNGVDVSTCLRIWTIVPHP